MFAELKQDRARNKHGKKARMVLFIYRLGNKIHYSTMPRILKRILLIPTKIIYNLFVMYPFGIELPFSTKIGGGGG